MPSIAKLRRYADAGGRELHVTAGAEGHAHCTGDGVRGHSMMAYGPANS